MAAWATGKHTVSTPHYSATDFVYITSLCIALDCVCSEWTLDDVRAIERPLTSELENEMVFNMVWSDPIPELPMDPRKGAHTSERDNFKGKKTRNVDIVLLVLVCSLTHIILHCR
jgi:hypothetical protein